MKYLKLYESFDASIENRWPSIKQDIIDICQELKDVNFSIIIDRSKNWPYFTNCIIYISKNLDGNFNCTTFSYQEISDEVERLIDYMKSAGWNKSQVNAIEISLGIRSNLLDIKNRYKDKDIKSKKFIEVGVVFTSE